MLKLFGVVTDTISMRKHWLIIFSFIIFLGSLVYKFTEVNVSFKKNHQKIQLAANHEVKSELKKLYKKEESILKSKSFKSRKPASIAPIKSLLVKKKFIPVLNDFNFGEIIKNGKSRYKVLDHYKVVLKSQLDQVHYDKIISNKFNYVIIETDYDVPNNYRVLKNQETGQLAILTGIIKVKISNVGVMSQLESQFSLKVNEEFPHINLVLYQADNLQDIENTLKQIQLQTGVVRASLEILETEYKHK